MSELPDLERDGFELDCGEALHREFPETFWIPPRDERSALEPGQLVKLIYRIRVVDDEGVEGVEVERMWTEVLGRTAKRYLGRLDNDPYCTDGIRAGLEVNFDARHVIQIYED